MKRFLSIFLCITLILSSTLVAFADTTSGLANFVTKNTYKDGQFKDVLKTDWFAENVKKAYEIGLVNGVSATAFKPHNNLTLAETLALAARLNSIYETGKADFVQGQPWYKVYVDYAISKNIIAKDEYTDFSKAATRAEFAVILSKALPADALKAKNTIDDGAIPDVKGTESFASAVYTLYRAGVLTGGSDNSYLPNNNISRAEVAAIISRMADESLRRTLTLKKGTLVSTASITMPENITLKIGESYTLKPTVTPASMAKSTITFESIDNSIATVDSKGVVKGVNAGGTIVVAYISDDVYAVCKVVVNGTGTSSSGSSTTGDDILSLLINGDGEDVLTELLETLIGTGALQGVGSQSDLSSLLGLLAGGSSQTGLSSLLGGNSQSTLLSLLGGGSQSGLLSLLGGGSQSGLSSLLGGGSQSGLLSLLGGGSQSGLSSLLGGGSQLDLLSLLGGGSQSGLSSLIGGGSQLDLLSLLGGQGSSGSSLSASQRSQLVSLLTSQLGVDVKSLSDAQLISLLTALLQQ